MTIYTFWGNKNESADGTSVLALQSGALIIGHAGDFTDAEYAYYSKSHILYPGTLTWTRKDFPWTVPDQFRAGSGGGGSGGGGTIYNWKTPGYNTTADLPASGNIRDDATLTFDTNTLYAWNGSSWTILAVFGVSGGGLPTLIQGGDSTTTSFTQVISGGDASTTSFTQVINGGSA